MVADISDDLIVYCANNAIIVIKAATLECVMKLVSKTLVKRYISVSIQKEPKQSQEEQKEISNKYIIVASSGIRQMVSVFTLV